MNLTSAFAGAANGYPIGRGQLEVSASGSDGGMRRILCDESMRR